MTNQKKREHDNGNNGYRCIHCGTNVNDWTDQPCVEREPDIVERLEKVLRFARIDSAFTVEKIAAITDAIVEIKRLHKSAK